MKTTTRTKTRTQNGNDEALDRFIENVGAIREALDVIRSAADDHFYTDPDQIHWGHVGDAGRILEGLNEIVAIIRSIK